MQEAAETGVPPVRPVFFADPDNPDLRAVDDQFLLGGDLLVSAAVNETGTPRPAALGTDWRAVHLVAEEQGDGDLPDLYLRRGAILPLGAVVQHTGEQDLNELELVVNLDDAGHAVGLLYEDAGDGYGYRAGEYRLTRFVAVRTGEQVTVTAAVVGGQWAAMERRLTVRVLAEPGLAGPGLAE
jgi:alpha-glucosidase